MADGEGRVFVREMVSQTYGLDEFRRAHVELYRSLLAARNLPLPAA